jgi:hypothetical protein
MRRVYRLWCPFYSTMDRISLGHELERHPYTIRVENGKLEAALDHLANLVKWEGVADCIEFHCHGAAAQLFVAAEPQVVDHRSVQRFGEQLRPFIRPGGMLELLACQVALQDYSGSIASLPENIEGYNAVYHGSLQRALIGKRWSSKPKSQPTPEERINRKVKISKPTELSDAEKAKIASTKIFNADEDFGTKFEFHGRGTINPKNKLTVAREEDGLLFCLTLARSSGAIVRAGIRIQFEEAKNGVSLIGNWEGPVFDFFPGGNVTYLGMAPFRPESWKPGTTETLFRKSRNGV